VAAFQAADASDTDAPDPTLFGPEAPRVKGGIDLAGDDYNANFRAASYQPIPHPDPDPLDCYGHGTLVAGTAVGAGVLADGSTYAGPYNAGTVSSHSWTIGPGVAPEADIYPVRIFGCEGTTALIVDALEWSVNNDMDVVNLSLGSVFRSYQDPDAVAASNAAEAGVIVVGVSGNNGPNTYMPSSPASATGAISVAANDPVQGFAAANVTTPGGLVQAINANGIPVDGLSAPVTVLRDGAGDISLGCDPAEYVDVAGTIVVTRRGACGRVARAIFAEKAGAVGAVMVNNVDALPPFEGQITQNPDTGEAFTVTIPFLGVKASDGAALDAAHGATADLSDVTIQNPSYLSTATFSSAGPRSGDGSLKPDLTAPGVTITSARIGTGSGWVTDSGTSLATPMVAGAAALVRQANPSWGQVKYWKAAIVNTAEPDLVTDYSTRLNGAGFLQAQRAVKTQVVATSVDETPMLSYKFHELATNLNLNRVVRLRNFSDQAITFTVGRTREAGRPHTVSMSAKTIRVPARGQASLSVSLRVPVATVGDSTEFRDVSGLVTFTPRNGANHGIALTVPYYLVPRAVSNVRVNLNTTTLEKKGMAPATVSNQLSSVAGTADWYSWGIVDGAQPGHGPNDIRAAGVQSFPSEELLVFGLSTHKRWSNAAAHEYHVLIDVDGDGELDYIVVAADFGDIAGPGPDGRVGSFVFDLRTGEGSVYFLADAPTDSSSMALPVLFEQLCNPGSPCLSASSPRIAYSVEAYAYDSWDSPPGVATFNVFDPALSTGMFNVVPARKKVTQQVTLDRAEFAVTPSLGLMVMSHDNRTSAEVNLLRIR
jgi:hypothetical protein